MSTSSLYPHHLLCEPGLTGSVMYTELHQLQRIISGLRETFIERSIIDRTNKAEIRPVEQSEGAESCRENVGNEIQLNRTE